MEMFVCLIKMTPACSNIFNMVEIMWKGLNSDVKKKVLTIINVNVLNKVNGTTPFEQKHIQFIELKLKNDS